MSTSTFPNHVPSIQASETSVSVPGSYLLDRDLNTTLQYLEDTKGNHMLLEDGRIIFDACGGAAVSCIGHRNEEVIEEVNRQNNHVPYCHSMFFKTRSTDMLAEELILSTDKRLARVFLISSGSEATEAAMKLGRQYYMEVGQTQRVNFIAREHSYHGSTLGALSMSGHVSRRAMYIPLLSDYIHRVSSCNAYRQRLIGETDSAFVKRKAVELDQKFRELGPETVIAFMCEPISGAAIGCATYVPGYLAAMKAICTKYGALFILDEVMCGMGRSGTLHAWQAEHSDEPGLDCVPDIQTIGKGLGGGYHQIAGLLICRKIVEGLKNGSGAFLHGQTYQSFPAASAAALAVLRIIKRDDLLANVRKQGAYLSSLLHEKLDSHPHVGDIRGMGLFWGIEFVQNKESKEPFDTVLKISERIKDTALSEKWNMSIYPCKGTVDGIRGDHIIIAPAYNITSQDVEHIANTLEGVIGEVFGALAKEIYLGQQKKNEAVGDGDTYMDESDLTSKL